MGQTSIKKTHAPAFKAKVAIEAIKEAETIGQLSSKFSVHSTQIGVWKKLAVEGILQIFSNSNAKVKKVLEDERDELYKKIGKLEVEKDFLKRKVGILT